MNKFYIFYILSILLTFVSAQEDTYLSSAQLDRIEEKKYYDYTK